MNTRIGTLTTGWRCPTVPFLPRIPAQLLWTSRSQSRIFPFGQPLSSSSPPFYIHHLHFYPSTRPPRQPLFLSLSTSLHFCKKSLSTPLDLLSLVVSRLLASLVFLLWPTYKYPLLPFCFCPSIHPSTHPPIHPPIHLSIHQSIHLSLPISTYLYRLLSTPIDFYLLLRTTHYPVYSNKLSTSQIQQRREVWNQKSRGIPDAQNTFAF